MTTHRKVFFAIALFFCVIFVANAAFIYFATSSYSGLVTESAYERGLAYNDTIKLAKKQSEQGDTGRIIFTDIGKLRGRITFSFSDKHNKPIANAKVEAKFIRPTQSGYDFTSSLKMEEIGVYTSNIELPLNGLWDIKITVAYNNNEYIKGERIIVK